MDDGRLIIQKVKQSDAGKYTCVAENIAGKTEKSVNIIVTSEYLPFLNKFHIITILSFILATPQVLQDPSSLTVDENEKSVLTCLYNTSHEKYTVVKWRKDGKPLKVRFC